jgi:cyclopropane fatty-acyl-phospholipid synthase-like methyltransferase
MAAPAVNGAYPDAEKNKAKGFVANIEIGDEKNQADYYDKANHYDTLWGTDNIHLGYYPHLADKKAIELTFPQAGQALTRRMIALGQIDSTSKVLDLGCGKGLACKEIAELTGAACTGVDLSPENIVRGNQIAKENPHLKLDFQVGSFTEVSESLINGGYTHVFSQVAFCHVHSMLPLTLSEVKKILDKGAVAVVNDYMGSDKEQSQMTRDHVMKRLHFEKLHGHKAWRHIAEDAGIEIMTYENLNRHMQQSYEHLVAAASKYSFKSADGVPIVENYRNTVEALKKNEIGMNLCLLKAA